MSWDHAIVAVLSGSLAALVTALVTQITKLRASKKRETALISAAEVDARSKFQGMLLDLAEKLMNGERAWQQEKSELLKRNYILARDLEDAQREVVRLKVEIEALRPTETV